MCKPYSCTYDYESWREVATFEDIESKVMQFDRSIESVPAQGGYADMRMSKNSFLIHS